jgi:methionyl-tRNA synthetase
MTGNRCLDRIIWGLIRSPDMSVAKRMGYVREGGNPTGRSRHEAGSFYRQDTVFHCIIFPAMLKAEGSYILPDNVPANEFLNLEGNKLSTSKKLGGLVHEYLVDFPGQQDVLRYALTSNAPETKDNDFTWKDFQARNNNELVAIYGNFINRVVVLTNKYYNGIVPQPNEFSEVDVATLTELKASGGNFKLCRTLPF